MRRSMKYAAALVAALLASVPVAADGPQTGTIDGSVLDAQSDPLPGVTVTLSSDFGQRTQVTTEDGKFRFNLLSPAVYTVKAELEGLGTASLSVPLQAGQRRGVKLTLKAAAAESITVTSEAPLISKYETSATATLESAVTEQVTFGTRDYHSTLETLPSVVQTQFSRNAGDMQPSINGTQWQESAGLVEGVDTTIVRRAGATRIMIPSTALKEVQMETAGFGAEYGRATGAVTNAIVKTGTNIFHGDFLYIPQNEKWRSAYKSVAVPRKNNLINSFEASLGGPLVLDKAWFFASYAKMNTNVSDVLADGTGLSVGWKSDPKILKLNFQPVPQHQLSFTGIDSYADALLINFRSADRFSPCRCALDEKLGTLEWSWSLGKNGLLEAKAARHKDDVGRDPVLRRVIDPAASPDSPLGNNFRYLDQQSGLVYNFIGQGLGAGFFNMTRKQGNLSYSMFRGVNELKFGVDYQDLRMDTLNDVGSQYFGFGYDENLPGGFATPRFKRVFAPSGVIVTTSDVRSGYGQDRVTLTDHWTLNLGLRLDSQKQKGDVGQTASDWTKVAPRLAATYDVRKDGRLLIKGTAGRYYQVMNQDYVNNQLALKPNGANLFDQYLWNPATQLYDRFQRTSTSITGEELANANIDPYYKDEVSAGVDWQFRPKWVFQSRAIYWEMKDLWWVSTQFDANGQVVTDLRNWNNDPYRGWRKYRGIQFEVNRALRDNWSFRGNYTLSKGTGNTFGGNVGTLTADTLFDGLGGVEVGTGATDATIRNRTGRSDADRTHNLNLVGLKTWTVGSNDLGLGVYFGYRSGERWGRTAPTNIEDLASGQVINTTTFVEPRDANQMKDTYTLTLKGTWNFPIWDQVRGRAAVEAYNITDQQEVISINVANGQPVPGRAAFQAPREIRFQLGVTF